MRISTQLLKSKVKPKGPLRSAAYVDLSNCNIDHIEKLLFCPKLKSLNLSGNNIESVSNLESCSELWKLDLNNNKVKCLEGLSRFIALGTLVLCNNDLSWPELERIRHMHILDLNLHGNPQLEKDPYYRIHVIDCLPNVWMLDGRLITSAERSKVKSFFHDSSITNHPVRHKLRKQQAFTPSSFKNINVNGIYGAKTTRLFRTFPVNTILNAETDKKRLMYLALNFEDDMKTEGFAKESSYLHKLLLARDKENEKCNMLLLLLVATLDFSIPRPLMEATLDSAQLTKFGDVAAMSLFLLPKDIRCSLLCFLLGSVKIERDVNVTGGLYDELYLCLYHTVSELTRQSRSPPKTAFNINKKTMELLRESRALIAAEVVQLLCVVPKFFDYIITDEGVQQMVSIATGNNLEVIDKVNMILFSNNHGLVLQHVYKDVAQLIVEGVEQATMKLLKNSKMSKFHKDILKIKASPNPDKPSSPPATTNASSKFSLINSAPSLAIHPASGTTKRGVLRLGDKVLLGPQNIARIVSIPDPKIVLVQMDAVPASSGAMVCQVQNSDERYAYIDTAKLQWDHRGYWRPIGTVGDRITIRPAEDSSDHSEGKSSNSSQKDDAGNSPLGVMLGPRTSPQNLITAPTIPCTVNLLDDSTKVSKKIPRGVSAQYKEKLRLQVSGQDDIEIDDCSTQLGTDSIKHDEDAMNRPVSAYTAVTSEVSTFESKAVSRHSSLESLDAAELEQFAEHALKISAAENGAWQKEDDVHTLVNCSIKIPQVPEGDETTPRYSSLSKDSHFHPTTPLSITPTSGGLSVVTFKDIPYAKELTGMTLNPEIARSRKNKSMRAMMLEESRPKSAMGKMYRGYHQTKAYEEKGSGIGKNAINDMTPPSRPSSSSKNKFSLKVQHGNTWLAEGRNLHLEDMISQPSTSRQPGWKDGLPAHPSSAASRPRSAASVKSTGRSFNSYKQSDYVTVSGLGGVPGYKISNRRPVTSLPRSKDISVDNYSFISPKRVRFLHQQNEDASPVDNIFTPSSLMLQHMAAKNGLQKQHRHKSGILCVECAYQQYQTDVIEELFSNDQMAAYEAENGEENYINYDVHMGHQDDLENQETISAYEPYDIHIPNGLDDVHSPEGGQVMKPNDDLHDTSQPQGQNVAVHGITVRVLNQSVTDQANAEIEDGSVEWNS